MYIDLNSFYNKQGLLEVDFLSLMYSIVVVYVTMYLTISFVGRLKQKFH